METIVNILMERDELNKTEALAEVQDIQNQIADAVSYDEVEEILMDYNLEMDYFMDLI